MPEPLNRFWRLPEVVNRTGLSRSTLMRRMAQGDFPSSRALGGGTVAWWADQVMEWMETRPETPFRPGHKPGHAEAKTTEQHAETTP